MTLALIVMVLGTLIGAVPYAPILLIALAAAVMAGSLLSFAFRRRTGRVRSDRPALPREPRRPAAQGADRDHHIPTAVAPRQGS